MNKFQFGSDLNQPHNFVTIDEQVPSVKIGGSYINGKEVFLARMLSYITRTTSSKDGSSKEVRPYSRPNLRPNARPSMQPNLLESNETVVVIISSTVNLRINFINSDLKITGMTRFADEKWSPQIEK